MYINTQISVIDTFKTELKMGTTAVHEYISYHIIYCLKLKLKMSNSKSKSKNKNNYNFLKCKKYSYEL